MILLIKVDGFGQLKSLNDFLGRIIADSTFREFRNNFYPSFGVTKNSKSTILNTNNNLSSYSLTDTTLSFGKDMINTTSILQFVAHPFFSNLSVPGRLEMFKSLCMDGTCVGEVSSRVYLTFETKSNAELILKIILDTLCSLSSHDSYTRTTFGDSYTLSHYKKEIDPDHGNMDYIHLVLIKSNKPGYEIFIGQNQPKHY